MYTSEDCQPIAWLIIISLLGGICQKHATYTSRGTTLTILYQAILLQMSIHFNVSLFLSTKYTNEDYQPVPWLVFNILRKLLLETCHFHNKTQLAILYQVILLLNVLLAYSLVFIKVSKEAFVRNMPFAE